MIEVQKNDIGTIFRGTIVDQDDGVVDISTATTKEILFRKPGGQILTKIASFTTDGTDGKLQYQSISGDLDTIGVWSIQAHVILDTGEWKSKIKTFRVLKNIE